MAEPGREQELAQWIRLEQTPGVGNEFARKLLAAFGLPANIFSATPAALLQIVPQHLASALLAPPSDATQRLIAQTREWLAEEDNHLLTLADAAYPRSLLEISDPPLMLYVKGRTELLARPALAVVGSRNATAQGIANAEKFSEALSCAGLTIVSGLALGIDTAAHVGGLRGSGSTIAVIGTGADIVYPARNRTLAHRIAAEGCIVSEYALGSGARRANFPRRNRLISGLAHGVLVVEAAAQSGSLITARVAGEQGRDVFAIPGSIHSPLAKGCHQLIKQGAKLVESAQDVLEELGQQNLAIPLPCAPTAPSPPATSPLLRALGYDPVDIDTLAVRCRLGIADLSAQLLALELEGRVEMLAGGMVRRLDAT